MTNRCKVERVCFKMIWYMFLINVGWSRAWFISLLQSFAIWKWRFIKPFNKQNANEREREWENNMMRRKVYSYWLKNEFDIMWRMGSMSLHIQSRKLYKKNFSIWNIMYCLSIRLSGRGVVLCLCSTSGHHSSDDCVFIIQLLIFMSLDLQ